MNKKRYTPPCLEIVEAQAGLLQQGFSTQDFTDGPGISDKPVTGGLSRRHHSQWDEWDDEEEEEEENW